MATHSEIALVNLQTATCWRGETGWLAFEHLEPITITKQHHWYSQFLIKDKSAVSQDNNKDYDITQAFRQSEEDK